VLCCVVLCCGLGYPSIIVQCRPRPLFKEVRTAPVLLGFEVGLLNLFC
jgi:hypothetical protein